ncbi:hypothetical protein LMG27952_04766 [Paraburkholderia hiiakae]|uniref:SlyX protein n=1 Tax=Paraburkholderia hiiakae TaxID=1081782 RepID=A0ABN7I5G8_9BURK|nr:hypothetical protein [Paraburkholderia hiiakae]CAD6548668.1 hypothetical protein LMG27952_04766 [Paraburkholderia hiiakae]
MTDETGDLTSEDWKLILAGVLELEAALQEFEVEMRDQVHGLQAGLDRVEINTALLQAEIARFSSALTKRRAVIDARMPL